MLQYVSAAHMYSVVRPEIVLFYTLIVKWIFHVVFHRKKEMSDYY